FQAEDGIRDGHVTGVQTCALPILGPSYFRCALAENNIAAILVVPLLTEDRRDIVLGERVPEVARPHQPLEPFGAASHFDQRLIRSEERRAGKQSTHRTALTS